MLGYLQIRSESIKSEVIKKLKRENMLSKNNKLNFEMCRFDLLVFLRIDQLLIKI